MRDTKIQWSDDTCNPVMGCDGCELWPSLAKIIVKLIELLARIANLPKASISRQVKMAADEFGSLPYKDVIARTVKKVILSERLAISERKAADISAEAKGSLLKCYAGRLTSNRAGKIKGYPSRFEQPITFPGRMAKAASACDLAGTTRADKPWLDGLPRLIFVSDMGDALSKDITFEYLRQEIVETAASSNGSRHRWLWLTKRPGRMAAFSRWLTKQGVAWPDNIMPMTSVTCERTVSRVKKLQGIDCRLRGLSVEPLWTPVTLPLDGIDWVVVGGESGLGAEPFHLEWALQILEQCRRAGVAFFVKQLGARPFVNDSPLSLVDRHGGDWLEWPEQLRVREMPEAFQSATAA